MYQRITLVITWLLGSLALGLWAESSNFARELVTTPVVLIPYGCWTMICIVGAAVEDNL